MEAWALRRHATRVLAARNAAALATGEEAPMSMTWSRMACSSWTASPMLKQGFCTYHTRGPASHSSMRTLCCNNPRHGGPPIARLMPKESLKQNANGGNGIMTSVRQPKTTSDD